jgi:DNA-binding FadR family transcriptional regulator
MAKLSPFDLRVSEQQSEVVVRVGSGSRRSGWASFHSRRPGHTERQIDQLIIEQALRAGERLPAQDELVERLGVSRTVIREATRFLMAKGLLEVRTESGVYVRSLNSTGCRTLQFQRVIDKREIVSYRIPW